MLGGVLAVCVREPRKCVSMLCRPRAARLVLLLTEIPYSCTDVIAQVLLLLPQTKRSFYASRTRT